MQIHVFTIFCNKHLCCTKVQFLARFSLEMLRFRIINYLPTYVDRLGYVYIGSYKYTLHECAIFNVLLVMIEKCERFFFHTRSNLISNLINFSMRNLINPLTFFSCAVVASILKYFLSRPSNSPPTLRF